MMKPANELCSEDVVDYAGCERVVATVDRIPRRVRIRFMDGQSVDVSPYMAFEVVQEAQRVV